MPYEFLDHTADIQLHSWGESMKESWCEMAYCLTDYMTDRQTIQPTRSVQLCVESTSVERLLYKFLDDILYRFYTDIAVHSLSIQALSIDGATCSLQATIHGQRFDPERHRVGCEIKAITFSNMQVSVDTPPYDLYVIVDI